ncbi:unnamed protein product, partial [Scytosiphon promiscuus]
MSYIPRLTLHPCELRGTVCPIRDWAAPKLFSHHLTAALVGIICQRTFPQICPHRRRVVSRHPMKSLIRSERKGTQRCGRGCPSSLMFSSTLLLVPHTARSCPPPVVQRGIARFGALPVQSPCKALPFLDSCPPRPLCTSRTKKTKDNALTHPPPPRRVTNRRVSPAPPPDPF